MPVVEEAQTPVLLGRPRIDSQWHTKMPAVEVRTDSPPRIADLQQDSHWPVAGEEQPLVLVHLRTDSRWHIDAVQVQGQMDSQLRDPDLPQCLGLMAAGQESPVMVHSQKDSQRHTNAVQLALLLPLSNGQLVCNRMPAIRIRNAQVSYRTFTTKMIVNSTLNGRRSTRSTTSGSTFRGSYSLQLSAEVKRIRRIDQ